ncbi:toxin-antitoxin system YwqK family antitoxin [Wenyingzhuangia sp. IMCC45533]
MKATLLILSLFVGLVTFGQDKSNIQVEKQGDLYKVTLLHENGMVAQTGYVSADKKLQGMWTSYDVNGKKKAIGNYVDGQKTGSWFHFNRNSELFTQVVYGVDSKIATVNTSMTKSQLADNDIEE